MEHELKIDDRERELLVLALKVMLNVCYDRGSPHRPHTGVMSDENLLGDVATAAVLRYKLKMMGKTNGS